MKLLVLVPSVLLISVLACQSGSGGAGVATATEPETNADSNRYEDQARAANLPWIQVPETRRHAKLREETRAELYRRIAVENDRAAQEAWTAGAAERLQAEAERGEKETEEDVPRKQPQ